MFTKREKKHQKTEISPTNHEGNEDRKNMILGLGPKGKPITENLAPLSSSQTDEKTELSQEIPQAKL